MRKHTGGFFKDTLKLVSGTVVAQALGLIFSPIIARLYTPDDFGTAAIFVSLTSIFGVLACLRYQFAVLLPQSDKEAANVLALSLSFAVIVTGITSFLIIVGRKPIIQILNAPDLYHYVWLFPVSLLFVGIPQALNHWHLRMKNFGRLATVKVSSAVARHGMQLILGIFGYIQAGGLIAGNLLGSALGVSLLGQHIWKHDVRRFKNDVRFERMITVLKRYRKFPLIDVWGGFLNNLSWQLPPLMLSYFFSQTIVGFYALSFRVIQAPMQLIGRAIVQVFFQRTSELRDNKFELAMTVESVFQRLVAFGLLPALLMTFAGREFFVVIFGENWTESGIYLQILAPWMFFRFISSPLSTLFTVLERQELTLIVHIAIVLTRLFALLIGGLLDNVYIALGLFSISGVIVYGGLTLWNMALSGVKLTKFPLLLLKYGSYTFPGIFILLIFKTCFDVSELSIVIMGLLLAMIYYAFIFYHDDTLRALFRKQLSQEAK